MHNHTHAHSVPGADQSRLMRLATMASTAAAIVLFASKLVGYLLTGSMAMFAVMVENALDILGSLVALFAVRYALMPPDDKHRFGHGKAEAVASLVLAMFVSLAAAFVVLSSFGILPHVHLSVHDGTIGLAIMGFSLVVTTGLVLLQRYVIRQTGSTVVQADNLHYMTDFMLNLGVIISLISATYFDLHAADQVIAVAIALYIGHGSVKIVRSSLIVLLDQELPRQQRERIREIMLAQPDVVDAHDIKTRTSGVQTFIQGHVVLDPQLSLQRVHDITDVIERRLLHEFTGAEILIHADPAGTERAPGQISFPT